MNQTHLNICSLFFEHLQILFGPNHVNVPVNNTPFIFSFECPTIGRPNAYSLCPRHVVSAYFAEKTSPKTLDIFRLFLIISIVLHFPVVLDPSNEAEAGSSRTLRLPESARLKIAKLNTLSPVRFPK